MSEKKIIYCETMAEAKDKYYDYINNHIKNVQEAYDKHSDAFKAVFPDVYNNRQIMQLYMNLQNHDMSKYSEEEFNSYLARFFPVNGSDPNSDKVKKDFKIAWFHHVHYNPHHPNHWALVDSRDEIYVINMPDIYIIEMLCDWMAMSKYYNSRTIDYWNSESGQKLPMSKYTKSKVNEFIDYMQNNKPHITLW